MDSNILTQILTKQNVKWIHIAQGRVQCQALVNMVLNLWVSYKARNSLVEGLLASQRKTLLSVLYHSDNEDKPFI